MYQTDKGVKILVLRKSQDFFKVKGVPFIDRIEEKITHVGAVEGDKRAAVITTKPDVVICDDETKIEDSSEVTIDGVTLTELQGHIFFKFKKNGGECTYSQYLFIDQLKSLKSKLNID